MNDIIDIEDNLATNQVVQKNQKYLKLLLEGPVTKGTIAFYVNPGIMQQINQTPHIPRKERLLTKFRECHFTDFNLTIYPFAYPATYISKIRAAKVGDFVRFHPGLKKDRKMIADAAFNNEIDVFLTTDKRLAHQVQGIGKVKFMLPEELCKLLSI